MRTKHSKGLESWVTLSEAAAPIIRRIAANQGVPVESAGFRKFGDLMPSVLKSVRDKMDEQPQ